MKVRCIKTLPGVNYLTVGKTYRAYDVLEGWGNTIKSFLIRDDEGDELYCLLNNCRHAKWEEVL